MNLFRHLENKGNESLLNRKGKRRLANKSATLKELKKHYKLMLKCFTDAIMQADEIISKIPSGARTRNLYPSLVQSTLFQQLSLTPELSAKKGRYGRTLMVIEDYIILPKLLSKADMPMNIKTRSIQGILNQRSSSTTIMDGDSPVLFFGYKKNKFGIYVEPQLIYIDEGKIQFRITENDLQLDLFMDNYSNEPNFVEVKPTLKKKAQ